MIVGFALMMLMPIFMIYTSHKQSVKTDVNLIQASSIVNKITDSADKVHYMGEPSKTTIEVRMPDNMEKIKFQNKSINFLVRVEDSTVDIRSYSDVNLTGNLKAGPGLREITIKAKEDAVKITD